MISDYQVVTATRIEDLQDRVRQGLQNGWQPAGGIAVLREEELGEHPAHLVFAQALVLPASANA